jgi:hypothetical protein
VSGGVERARADLGLWFLGVGTAGYLVSKLVSSLL